AVASSIEGDYESTGDLRVFAVPSGRVLRDMRSQDFGYTAEFSSDGRHLVTTGPIDPAVIWDLDSRRPVETLDASNGTVDAAALSPDGRSLALSGDSFEGDPSKSNSVEIRSLATGRTTVRLTGTDAIGTSLRFSPIGRLVTTTGFDH